MEKPGSEYNYQELILQNRLREQSMHLLRLERKRVLLEKQNFETLRILSLSYLTIIDDLKFENSESMKMTMGIKCAMTNPIKELTIYTNYNLWENQSI